MINTTEPTKKEKRAAQRHVHYELNKERLAAYRHEYYERNKEKATEYHRKFPLISIDSEVCAELDRVVHERFPETDGHKTGYKQKSRTMTLRWLIEQHKILSLIKEFGLTPEEARSLRKTGSLYDEPDVKT